VPWQKAKSNHILLALLVTSLIAATRRLFYMGVLGYLLGR
jgi:hypothetical protein